MLTVSFHVTSKDFLINLKSYKFVLTPSQNFMVCNYYTFHLFSVAFIWCKAGVIFFVFVYNVFIFTLLEREREGNVSTC